MAGRACGPGFYGRVRRGHSHPYGPWPVPLVCGSARAHVGTGDQRSVRPVLGCTDAADVGDPLCLAPGTALPQTRNPAGGSTGSTRHPERDRDSCSNQQAKPPGSRSTARAGRSSSNAKAHAHGHRRPGKQLRHRDPLRGSWRRPAGGVDPRLSAQRPCLGRAGPGTAQGRLPGHHLRPARVRSVQPASHRV